MLANIMIEHTNNEELHPCFSAFRQTLTHITLHCFETSFSAFVTLVDYFPNITSLRLGSFDIRPDEGPVPALSRPLRGKISIRSSRRCVEFFDRLAKLNPEYEELVLEYTLLKTEVAESLLRLCASTVKYLRLTAKFEREHLIRKHLHCTY